MSIGRIVVWRKFTRLALWHDGGQIGINEGAGL